MLNNGNLFIFEDTDLIWGFDSKDPHFSTPQRSEYDCGDYIAVDPFPCYSHDAKLVNQVIDDICKRLPLPFKTEFYSVPFESVGRTNGSCFYGEEYVDFVSRIMLFGKRIPIHPAMTRYLVSHEYGHAVDNAIEKANKYAFGEFHKKYAEVRKFKRNENLVSSYGGRTWHNSIGEIMANDIRILLLGYESEFWVHDVLHPLNYSIQDSLLQFWNKELETMKTFKTVKKDVK